MPNVRRLVAKGDYIFVVSGKVPGIQQYVVGGMRVEEKIDALAAYARFPKNRLRMDDNGKVQGNIIVTPEGAQHPLDRHDSQTFSNRVKNFIVGSHPIALQSDAEVAIGREQSLPKLSQLLGRPGNRLIDVLSRWSKLDEPQVRELVAWLQGIKASV